MRAPNSMSILCISHSATINTLAELRYVIISSQKQSVSVSIDRSTEKMLSNITRVLLLFLWLVIINCNGNGVNSESPGFFLKVTKNVPRLGRRSHSLSDFENFFLKTSKSVPRIGRSSNQVRHFLNSNWIIFAMKRIIYLMNYLK